MKKNVSLEIISENSCKNIRDGTGEENPYNYSNTDLEN